MSVVALPAQHSTNDKSGHGLHEVFGLVGVDLVQVVPDLVPRPNPKDICF